MERDVALLQQYVRAKDAEAFATLAQQHLGMVYGTALRILGNTHDAEDVAQECFLGLARQAGAVRNSVPGWLHNAAVSRSLNAARGATRRQRHEEAVAMQRREAALAPQTEWSEIAEHVDVALAELPDDLREALVLRFLEQKTQAEIAKQMGVRRATVAARVDRGLAQLRERLGTRGIVASAAILSALLLSNTAQAVPATLAAGVGKVALAGVGTSTASATAAAATSGGVAAKAGLVAVVAAALLAAALAVNVLRHRAPPQIGLTPPPTTTEQETEPAPSPALASPFPPPEKTVVIDPNVIWSRTNNWAGNEGTSYCWDEGEQDRRIFHVGVPARRHVWVYRLNAPVEVERYPILVISYRAVLAEPTGYILWMDDGTGPDHGGIYPVRGSEFQADGEKHEIRKDLRALNPRGPIRTIALGLACFRFELLDLRFEIAPGAPPPQKIAPVGRIQVKVLDHLSRPVAGASVIADSERSNFAVTAQTDAKGIAEVSPLDNPSGKHMLHVTKATMTQAEVRDLDAVPGDPVTVVLRPTREFSGQVVDETGRPIADAVVEFWIRSVEQPGGKGAFRIFPLERSLTDANGTWRSPPLDDTAESIQLRLIHPQYSSDDWGDQFTATVLEKIRAGTQVSVMQRGVALTGIVRSADGKPVAGAWVATGEDRLRAYVPAVVATDENGAFRLDHTRPGLLVLTVQARGYGPQLARLDARSDMAPLALTLPAPKRIQFHIVDDAGKPIAGARVFADAWKGCRSLDWDMDTDEEGRATWPEAPADAVAYGIEARDYAPVRNLPLMSQEDEHLITLHKPRSGSEEGAAEVPPLMRRRR